VHYAKVANFCGNKTANIYVNKKAERTAQMTARWAL